MWIRARDRVTRSRLRVDSRAPRPVRCSGMGHERRPFEKDHFHAPHLSARPRRAFVRRLRHGAFRLDGSARQHGGRLRALLRRADISRRLWTDPDAPLRASDQGPPVPSVHRRRPIGRSGAPGGAARPPPHPRGAADARSQGRLAGASCRQDRGETAAARIRPVRDLPPRSIGRGNAPKAGERLSSKRPPLHIAPTSNEHRRVHRPPRSCPAQSPT